MAAIIPFFIQHKGCPHRCLFCDQTTITGKQSQESSEAGDSLEETIDLWLNRYKLRTNVELAFYGGSFTCLSEFLQIELLSTVKPYLDNGEIASVRLSTRPDCISNETCELLGRYGVKTVELGVQSMSERVLDIAERNHSTRDVEIAARLIRNGGFSLGIQLMPGLPGETTRSFYKTVDRVIDLAPDFVRIYPALVLENTGLEQMYRESAYKPLSMNRAITLTRKARDSFLEKGIGVIRMGLQPSEELEKKVVAGPYHQAFGELVVSRGWFLKARQIFKRAVGEGRVHITLSNRDLSSFVGMKKRNIKRLEQLFPQCRLKLTADNTMERGQIRYVVS